MGGGRGGGTPPGGGGGRGPVFVPEVIGGGRGAPGGGRLPLAVGFIGGAGGGGGGAVLPRGGFGGFVLPGGGLRGGQPGLPNIPDGICTKSFLELMPDPAVVPTDILISESAQNLPLVLLRFSEP